VYYGINETTQKKKRSETNRREKRTGLVVNLFEGVIDNPLRHAGLCAVNLIAKILDFLVELLEQKLVVSQWCAIVVAHFSFDV